MATGGPRSSSDEEEELSFHDSDFDTSEESDVDESTLTEEEKIVREKRHRRHARCEKEYEILASTLNLDPNTDRKIILQKTIDAVQIRTEVNKQIHEETMRIRRQNEELERLETFLMANLPDGHVAEEALRESNKEKDDDDSDTKK